MLLAAVLVLTALVLLDLAPTLAIVRRLREQTSTRGQVAHLHMAQLVGRSVPADVRTVAADGVVVTGEALRLGSVLVVFVATWCDACHTDLPRLKEHAAARRVAGDTVLVVVEAPSAGDAGELVAELEGLATVVVESSGGDRPLHTTFGADGYPTYLDLRNGVVTDARPSMVGVPVPAGA